MTYVVFPDEGHGFAKPTNNIAFNAVTENFLATCLGGRAEPVGDTLEPSTAQVETGAEFVQGLKDPPTYPVPPDYPTGRRLGIGRAIAPLLQFAGGSSASATSTRRPLSETIAQTGLASPTRPGARRD